MEALRIAGCLGGGRGNQEQELLTAAIKRMAVGPVQSDWGRQSRDTLTCQHTETGKATGKWEGQGWRWTLGVWFGAT